MLSVNIGALVTGAVFAATSLIAAATQANAWTTKIIDYETHDVLGSDYLISGAALDALLKNGVYEDIGYVPGSQPGRQYIRGGKGWATNPWPACNQGYHRFTSSWVHTQKRWGIAFWLVKITKTGFYELKSGYKATHNKTTHANYFIYDYPRGEGRRTLGQYFLDVDWNNRNKFLIAARTVDQKEGWKNVFQKLQTVRCYHGGDVSMIALDARGNDSSSDSDGGYWRYIGTTWKGKKCVEPKKPVRHQAAIRHLLVGSKKKDVKPVNQGGSNFILLRSGDQLSKE